MTSEAEQARRLRDARIREAYEAGASLREAAAANGVSHEGARRALAREGVAPRRGTAAGLRTGRLKPVAAEHFAAWVARACEMGWSQAEAARRLGCSEKSMLVWSRRGAPAYVGLACEALERTWRRDDDG